MLTVDVANSVNRGVCEKLPTVFAAHAMPTTAIIWSGV